MPSVHVDISNLNAGQSFIYKAVGEHFLRQSQGPTQASLALQVQGRRRKCSRSASLAPTLVHNTHRLAHSTTRFLPWRLSGRLIRALNLKQLLGNKCMALAPTGVAADNIGGCTYHSKIPLPLTNIGRLEVKLKKGTKR